MRKNKKKEYKYLLAEKIGMNQDISWYDAQNILQYDKRYQNLLEEDRELIFKNYINGLFEKIEFDFNNLLKESAFITKDTLLDDISIKELINLLNSDLRARRMAKYPEKRDKYIRARVKSLKLMHDKQMKERKRNTNKNKLEENDIN